MEEVQTLAQPSHKDTLRLLLAGALIYAKPAHIPLEDYFARLRAGAYARRLAQGTLSTGTPMATPASLGMYAQLDPMRDLLEMVQGMLRDRERGRIQYMMRRQLALQRQRAIHQAQHQAQQGWYQGGYDQSQGHVQQTVAHQVGYHLPIVPHAHYAEHLTADPQLSGADGVLDGDDEDDL